MLASIVIGTIILVILLVVYREYKNEKKYQEERTKQKERKKKKLTPKVTRRSPSAPKAEAEKETSPAAPSSEIPQEKPSAPVQKPIPPATEKKVQEIPVSKPEEHKAPKKSPDQKKPKPSTEPAEEKKPAAPEEEALELPKGEYPLFNYDRLIEMGLSEAEAHEFIQELIPQIGDQIPLIDEAMEIPDFHQMERLTHSIKGSSTTIGTGGVSDLLVDYNTYLKEGKEVRIAKAYQEHLKRYYEKLKKQFPKER